MGEFGVSTKEEAKKSSTSAITATTNTSNVLGLGCVRVQKQQQQHNHEEAFPSSNKTMMMMVHHNHHHRPLSPPSFDGDGPTTTTQDTSLTNNNHQQYLNINAALSGVVPAPLGVVRNLQPFDNNFSAYTPATTTTTTRSAFKSPGAGGMAATSMGFPFTSAQWKELERQAMIYKYMMASLPVPPDLLIPASSRSPLDGGFNLRLSSSTDPEPGRCRRTDGKKWRCSRDVAPNHKYCERHMHRGRPRSRKPVEVHTNNNNNSTISTINSSIVNGNQQVKRARHDCDPFPTSAVTVAISNPTTRRDGSSSHFFSATTTAQPYLESSLSLDNFGVKAANFDSVASLSSNKEPRGLDWMLNGDPVSLGGSESEWQSLMHNKVGFDAMSSCSDTEPHYLNSFALYSSGLEQQNRRPTMFLNPLLPMESLQSEKPRGFIDAWSNASTEQSNANKNSVSSTGKLSLSSLDLSVGGGSVHEDMGTNEVGLGLMDHDGDTNNANDTKTSLYNWLTPAPWVDSTPGGPLAEVLRPSTVTATNDAAAASNSDPSSPIMTHAGSNSPLGGTMVSSPSGVLHKALASLSDSSSNSSPTVASSRANNSEIALLRFNQK